MQDQPEAMQNIDVEAYKMEAIQQLIEHKQLPISLEDFDAKVKSFLHIKPNVSLSSIISCPFVWVILVIFKGV